MLGKAHLTIGIASAITVMMPQDLPAALPVIAGAAAGSLICDIDCDGVREKTDSSGWRKVSYIIAAAALAAEYSLGSESSVRANMSERSPYIWCAGIAGLALIFTFAGISSHRGFSHSLLALAGETLCLWLVFPAAAQPFAIAFASHLILDVMNMKKVRLFYPSGKGISLGWFYADRLANKVTEIIGALWLILALLLITV